MSGQVMLCFDDGLEMHARAAQLLQEKCLRGTFGAVPSRDGLPGFLNAGQMAEMSMHGHCICNHSMSHLWLGQGQPKPGVRPRLREELTADALAARKWLNDRGLAGDYYMAPFGTANVDGPAHIKTLLAEGIRWIRLTVGAPMPDGGWTPEGGKRLYPLGFAGPLIGISAAIDIRWPKAIDDAVAAAAECSALAVLVFHNVSHVAGNAMDVTWEMFCQEVDRIAEFVDAGRLACVTPTDLVPPV